jgi:hypothetical protein
MHADQVGYSGCALLQHRADGNAEQYYLFDEASCHNASRGYFPDHTRTLSRLLVMTIFGTSYVYLNSEMKSHDRIVCGAFTSGGIRGKEGKSVWTMSIMLVQREYDASYRI